MCKRVFRQIDKYKVLIAMAIVLSLSMSVVNAQVWDADVRVNEDANIQNLSLNNAWNVSYSERYIHIAYVDDRNVTNETFYTSSDDYGETWSTDSLLGAYEKPSIIADGFDVHVVGQFHTGSDFEIMYRHSPDNGVAWNAEINLSNTTGVNSEDPSIAFSGNTCHVVWQENGDIYYAASTDGGSGWVAWDTTHLVTGAPVALNPTIATSGSYVHVLWCDNRNGANEIFSKSYNGSAWGADVLVSADNSNESVNPCVAASGSNVFAVWEDMRDGEVKVYYDFSPNNGTSWQASDVRMVDVSVSEETEHPSVSAEGSDVYVVWTDYRHGVSNPEIYFRRSTDSGVHWGDNERLTDEAGASRDPSIFASGDELHLVWIDERVDVDVFYKHAGPVQPDNHIRDAVDPTYVGNDTLNIDGTNQTMEQNVVVGDTAIYFINIQNDGVVTDNITVTGADSLGGWQVNYYDDTTAGSVITSQIVGAGWSTGDMAPDSIRKIRLEVTLPDVPDSSSHSALVMSVSANDTTKKDAVLALTTFLAGFQPDNQIKNSADTVYVGNDIYNADGVTQTVQQSISFSDTAIYHILIQNDADDADEMILTGPSGGSGWTVEYYDAETGGTNISVAMSTIGWFSGSILPDSSRIIRAEVISPASSAPQFSALIRSTSTSDTTKVDVVGAVTDNGTGIDEDNSLKIGDLSLDIHPVHKAAKVSFNLPHMTDVDISFYDITGRMIRNLFSDTQIPGYYEMHWDGLDSYGNSVPQGVYFCRLKTSDRTIQAKFILID